LYAHKSIRQLKNKAKGSTVISSTSVGATFDPDSGSWSQLAPTSEATSSSTESSVSADNFTVSEESLSGFALL